MSELKPCPFCGGEAFIEQGNLYCWGQCKQCGSQSAAQTSAEKATNAWDARASSPDPAREALVGALKDLFEAFTQLRALAEQGHKGATK